MSQRNTLDLGQVSFWDSTPEEREEAFSELRRSEPVSWHPMPPSPIMPDPDPDDGFWAVVRYEDIRAVSRDKESFTSTKGVHLDDMPPELNQAALSFLGMDDPQHARLRRLVSTSFTPRQVHKLADGIARDAAQIVDDLAGHETGDFVELVSRWLPTLTIMRMIGVPDADRPKIAEAAQAAVAWNDPDFLGDRDAKEVMTDVVTTFHLTAREMAEHRRRHPADDLMTALVQAEVDGDRLTLEEIGAFFVLLSIAGNDTTRQTTSHAMLALSRFPDQRRALLSDLDGSIETAVEEFVRWATPVMTFRRVATRDTEIGGQQIEQGSRVVMFYASGNRDESVFDDPGRFDVLRDPNPHLGFGGGGPHYCMGAPVAKMQLRALFTNLLGRYPHLEVGDPHYLVSNHIHTITKMPMHRGAAA